VGDSAEDGLAGSTVLDAALVAVMLQAIVLAGAHSDAGAVVGVALVAALGTLAATLQSVSRTKTGLKIYCYLELCGRQGGAQCNHSQLY
jgi:hypothetical protein